MSKYLLFGEDKLKKEQAVKKLKEKFGKKYSVHNIEQFDFSRADLSIQDLQAKLQAVPFLAKKRLLIISNVLSSFNKNQTKKREIVSRQLTAAPETTILVIIEEKVHHATAKKLGQSGFKVKDFKSSYGYQLESWLKDKVDQMDLSIDSKNTKLVIERLGSDSGAIYQELIKLKHYLGYDDRRKITSEDIEQVVSIKTDLVIFDLIDKVATKQLDKAVEYLFDLLDQGVSETYIVAMIDSTLTKIIQALDCGEQEESLSPDKLKNKFGWHPYVSKKIFSQMKSFNKKALIDSYQKLYQTDYNLKLAKTEPKTQLALFLSQL